MFRLEQSECIVLLLSADFFDNDECQMILTQALKRQQDGTACVIPLLARPVDWQVSELGAFSCLPANGVAITTWKHMDEGWLNAIQGLKRILGRDVFSSSSLYPAGKRAYTDRERMLRLLYRTYHISLNDSLQGIAWMELGLAEHPNAVRNATNLLQQRPDGTERVLPTGTTILDAYDQAEEELLILGVPGTGKSTLLLELAQQIIKRAEADETHPLPVILPLSSWATTRPVLTNWLVEQMARIYGIPLTLSGRWIRQGQVIPLLDGLDEMEEAARPLCIAAINAYHAAHVAPLVVCSRQSEYDVASIRQRLTLQNAIVVQPLSQEQVEHALSLGGKPLVALRESLRGNPTLRDLATTPLMLGVLFLAYQETATSKLSQQEAVLEHQIWTDYVARMVQQKGADRQVTPDKPAKRYSLEHTTSWLGWLARQMREHNQTLFHGEYLLEDWLPVTQQRIAWWLVVRVPAVILGILTSILLSIFFLLNSWWNINLAIIFQIGLAGGFIGWCCSENHPGKTLIGASISNKSLWEHARKVQLPRFLGSMLFGCLIAASVGLGGNFLPSTTSYWLPYNISIGISMFISAWLLQFLFAHVAHLPGRSPSRWSRLLRWIQTISGRRALWAGTIFGIGMSLGFTLAWGLKGTYGGIVVNLGLGLIQGPGYGLIYAGTTYIVSTILDAQTGTLLLAERVRWSWHNVLEWRHLGMSLIVAFASLCYFELSVGLVIGTVLIDTTGDLLDGLRFWPVLGPNVGLSFGLSFGLGYWLLLGLYKGMTPEHLENQDRRWFNQGLGRSLRNSFLLSLLCAGTISGVGTLSLKRGYSTHLVGLNVLDNPAIINPAAVGYLFLGSWLIVWVAAGGLTILRHYLLRLLLARSHTFPWQARSFLDDATARVLLRRIGGGYGFVHRRLLDYFANPGLPPSE